MQDISFVFCIHKEFELGKRLVEQLNYFYPAQKIVCIADGYWNEKSNYFIDVCHFYKIEYFQGKELKSNDGKQWLKRLFKIAIERLDTKWIIKLDPDTYILRKFKSIPECDIAGNIIYFGNQVMMNGGCRAYKRKTIKSILQSALLDENIYQEERFKYRRTLENKIYSEDAILMDLIIKLGLYIKEWEEVNCYFNSSHHRKNDYAAIHPVKV